MKLLQTLPRRPLALLLAGATPLILCVVLGHLRAQVSSAPAALVLVVVVVAAASTGLRSAGLLAAASSAVWFDVLLTRPYGQLAIHDREDLEAMVLLMVVGVAVTELSLWGRRQQSEASRTIGFLDGLVVSADSAQAVDRAANDPATGLAAELAARITEVLGVDRCTFVRGGAGSALPRLVRSGDLLGRGLSHEVGRDGLPVDTEVAIDVTDGGEVLGSFLVVAASRVARPSRDQRRTAVLLADQLAPALLRGSRRGAGPAGSGRGGAVGQGVVVGQ